MAPTFSSSLPLKAWACPRGLAWSLLGELQLSVPWLCQNPPSGLTWGSLFPLSCPQASGPQAAAPLTEVPHCSDSWGPAGPCAAVHAQGACSDFLPELRGAHDQMQQTTSPNLGPQPVLRMFHSFYCSNIHITENLPPYPFLSAWFSGIKYTLAPLCSRSPPPTSRELSSSCKTETLSPSNDDPHHSSLPLARVTSTLLCVFLVLTTLSASCTRSHFVTGFFHSAGTQGSSLWWPVSEFSSFKNLLLHQVERLQFTYLATDGQMLGLLPCFNCYEERCREHG